VPVPDRRAFGLAEGLRVGIRQRRAVDVAVIVDPARDRPVAVAVDDRVSGQPGAIGRPETHGDDGERDETAETHPGEHLDQDVDRLIHRSACSEGNGEEEVEPPKGIEPLTFSLRVRCSAD
jgi:bifunctional DNA-binding transcriptional regulator/antitoxin component of YhaV-PrlF toxin-antitoxin module